MKQTNSKKGACLAASVIVTAILILGWHFAVPHLTEQINLAKFVSYGILLFGLTWILDAISAFFKEPEEADEKELLAVRQNRRALLGLVVFLLYSALAHAVVAVFFDGGNRELMFKTASIEKCAFAVIGFTLLLQGALPGKKTWSIVSGVVSFALGAGLSFVLDSRIVMVIAAAVTFVFYAVNAFSLPKESALPGKETIGKPILFIALLSIVMIARFFTPITSLGRVMNFVVSGAINLVAALILDGILLAIFKAAGKKDSSASGVKQQESQLAGVGK